jgi:2-polyprenyl-3-methyl-5-hydroxy-6-metoxy-1,4-benzoquinol methylase
LPQVKAQYERLPYPPCNPLDEHKRLQQTWLESLPMINHYCFQGRQDFGGGFRVLVAGGGTGDATIFLAEQLKSTNAEIVHLDLSEASITIAKERARIRKLNNIVWIQESLLSLPELGLGKFDYINCVGVLHHLTDPDAGLRALRSVLHPDGALALMVYGEIGRTGVYHMQRLLRLANEGCSEAVKISNAKEVLADLPPSNWFGLAGDLYYDRNNGDAGIYDLLLHSQDRAYTVGQIVEWIVDGHGLHPCFSDVHRGRFPYLPHMTLGTAAHGMRARLPAMTERERLSMSELLVGDLILHSFYVVASPAATAPYGQGDYVPFFYHEPLDAATLQAMFAPKNGAPTRLQHKFLGLTVDVDAGRYSGKILGLIDGKRTFDQIFAQLRADPANGVLPDDAALFADFRPVYETLNAIERLLLRHVSCPAL